MGDALCGNDCIGSNTKFQYLSKAIPFPDQVDHMLLNSLRVP